MITLIRFFKKDFTLGILTKDNNIFFTLELPFKDNQKNISCIKSGIYNIIKWKSPKHGDCLKICDVPNRTNILIHAGNYLKDTKGCILIGEMIKNDGTIYNSKIALKKLIYIINDNDKIEIK